MRRGTTRRVSERTLRVMLSSSVGGNQVYSSQASYELRNGVRGNTMCDNRFRYQRNQSYPAASLPPLNGLVAHISGSVVQALNHQTITTSQISRLIGLNTKSTTGVGVINAITTFCALFVPYCSIRDNVVSSRLAKSSRVIPPSVLYQPGDSRLGCRL